MERRIVATIGELVATIILLAYTLFCFLCEYNQQMLFNWLGIMIYIYAIYTWRCKTGSRWFSPYTIFMTFFLLFNYGQPIMWAFNVHNPTEIGTGVLYYGSGYAPSQNDLLNAQKYICIAMLLFHFFALFASKRNKRTVKLNYIGNDNKDALNENLTAKSMKIICKWLLIITAPIALIYSFINLTIARLYGYNALYYGNHSTQSGYTQIALFFFFPAIVGYLIGSHYSKKSRIVAYFIFGLYTILNLLSGDRGSWLYSLIILVWLHSHYVKIPAKKYLKWIIIAVICVYVLSAFTNVRNSGLNVSGSDIISTFTVKNSPIFDAVFEMGGSMGIIVFLLHAGSNIYPYMNTYITAFLGVVSSRTLSFLGVKQIFIADWFSQSYLGINWGTGFSMLGEAFINGGLYGSFAYVAILGYIHGKLLQYVSYENRSSLKLFITVTSLNIIVGFTRGALYLVLKNLFYGVFIVSICIVLLSKRLQRNTVLEKN